MYNMAGATGRLRSRCGKLALGLAAVGWLGCAGHCASYVANVKMVTGCSMEPLLSDGDLVLAESVCTLTWTKWLNFRQLKKGDVVYIRDKNDPQSYICKRLIAFEHDVVLNNMTGQPHRVGKGQVWLEGDNSNMSDDSRERGGFHLGLVVGRIYFKIYPEFKAIR